MLLISLINYRVVERLRSLFMAISLLLLIAVLLWGRDLNGGKRWLEIAGISIQPSELAKFGLMIFMCSYMSRHRDEMNTFRYGMLPMLIAIGFIAGLVMLQPNMSMAVIIGFIGVVLLYLGGCNLKQLFVLGIVAIIAFFVLARSAEYRMDRLTSFSNPESDPQGTGYQLLQSYYAIGSGGFFGKGLNNSYQKLLYMTYGESDFIFAILCEEFGFVGGLFVILMYAWIVFRGIVIAMRCRNRFGSLLAAGISIVFGFQVFVNIGVVTGLLPTTGQALPFISAGGTSLLVFLAAMGLLLSISRDTNPRT
jgi:cell division protein FtsW